MKISIQPDLCVSCFSWCELPTPGTRLCLDCKEAQEEALRVVNEWHNELLSSVQQERQQQDRKDQFVYVAISSILAIAVCGVVGFCLLVR